MCVCVCVCVCVLVCLYVFIYTNGVKVISDGECIYDKNENTAGMHVRCRGPSADPVGLQMKRLPPVPFASGDERAAGYL